MGVRPLIEVNQNRKTAAIITTVKMIVRLLRLFFFVCSMWHLFRVILVMLMLYSCVTGKRGYGLLPILFPCSLALSLVTIACRRADVNINSGAEIAVLERYFVDAAGAFFMLA